MKENYTFLNSIGKIRNFLTGIKIPAKITFIILGILSTIWFLIRVIPKPQRATYPCMRAAAPWASAFVVYLLGLSASVFSLKKFKQNFASARYLIAGVFLFAGLAVSFITIPFNQNKAISAVAETPHEAGNQPMGTAVGIFPGRVAWIYDTASTNASCTNNYGDGYFLDKNTNQEVVDKMLIDAVFNITGEATIADAWDAIFRFHNQQRGKGSVGYVNTEKVFLKINRTSAWSGNFNTGDLSRTNNSNYAISETSPQLVTSVLRHLVNYVGVPQNLIYIGDPMKHIYKDEYEKWYAEFPNVHYMDYNYNTLGREAFTESTTAKIYYADSGAVLRTGSWSSALTGDPVYSDYLYTIFEEMEYMINIPTLKGHTHGGVTMFAKNHFGSQTREDAKHLHGGLVKMGDDPTRDSYGMYRVLVDLMSDKLLGGKTLIFIMDALYCSEHEVNKPDKFLKAPWNNDWTSSIFISQDPVAIESVGFDLLYYELDGTNGLDAFPHYGAVDDYLHQAADSANWPDGITYDPEYDGILIPSLGVHEHWNNTTDMQYTRNLGTGSGIELVKINRNLLAIPEIITVDNTELPSNQVNVIYIDSLNTKWIGTDKGMARLTDKGWTLYDTSNILFNDKVNDIEYELTSYGKELWIATDSGLTVASYNLDGITGSTTYVDANSGLVDNKVSNVCVDIYHNRWISTDSAITVFRGNKWDSILTATDPMGETFNFADYRVTDLAAYNFDSMAFATTAGKGILRYTYDLVDGFTGASTYGAPWSAITPGNNIQSVDVKGQLQWYGTTDGAYLHPTNLAKDNWGRYDTDSGLVDNNVTNVHIDKNDYIWLGTSNGLSIFTGTDWYKYTEDEGLVNNVINSITSDIEGNVWIATSGGIQWFSSIPGIVTKLRAPVLTSPANEMSSATTSPTLDWADVNGAQWYELEVDTTDAFVSPVISLSNISTSTQQVSGLKNNTTYYWRVAASRTGETSAWSGVWHFSTQPSAINELSNDEHISIYPNPVKNELRINASLNRNQNIRIMIYSIDGKLMTTPVDEFISNKNQIITIDMSDEFKYLPGVYIVNIKGDTFARAIKINKQ